MSWIIVFVIGLIMGAGLAVAGVKDLQKKVKKSDDRERELLREIKNLKSEISVYEKEPKVAPEEFEQFKKQFANCAAQNEVLRDSIEKITNQFVNETLKYICDNVTPNNFEASKKRMQKVFDLCRKLRIQFSAGDAQEFFKKIKEVYETEVSKQAAREEQARIKERIRQEQREERERQQELEKLEREEGALQAALNKALKEANDKHSDEIEKLKRQLAEAHAKNERAKSMAQLTKAGYVYVISNIGSFGEKVFKVGMTRRLEPYDRIQELGDASVPFPFDVHMMISSENAPELETTLHQNLNKNRINKVNLRKEFFRVDLDEIGAIVSKCHGKVEYNASPDAFEFRETLLIEERGDQVEYDSTQEIDDDIEAA